MIQVNSVDEKKPVVHAVDEVLRTRRPNDPFAVFGEKMNAQCC